MGSKADETADASVASRLGLEAGQLVQEFGWDEDVDEDLREAIESATQGEMLDETEHTVADVVVLWWRSDDGDLADGLMDVIGALDGKGTIWLFTPKRGREHHVDPADIQEAAQTAGLVPSSSVALTPDWAGNRLVPAGARRQSS